MGPSVLAVIIKNRQVAVGIDAVHQTAHRVVPVAHAVLADRLLDPLWGRVRPQPGVALALCNSINEACLTGVGSVGESTI